MISSAATLDLKPHVDSIWLPLDIYILVTELEIPVNAILREGHQLAHDIQ